MMHVQPWEMVWGCQCVLCSVTLEAVLCPVVLRLINICDNKQGFLAPVAWNFAPGACSN